MLEITRIRTEKDSIIEGLKKRNLDVAPTIDQILDKDQQWRSAKTDLEAIAAEQNQLAKQIGELFKQGKQEEANTAKIRTGELKVKETELKSLVDGLDQEITQLLYTLPNVPNELVKAGKDEKDNEIVFEDGEQPTFSSERDLAKKYDPDILYGWNDLTNVTSRKYTTFLNALGGSIGDNILGTELVMRDINTNRYWKFEFHSWTQGDAGGGFSYTRTLIKTANNFIKLEEHRNQQIDKIL